MDQEVVTDDDKQGTIMQEKTDVEKSALGYDVITRHKAVEEDIDEENQKILELAELKKNLESALESDYAGYDLHPEIEAKREKFSEKKEVKLIIEGLSEEINGKFNEFTEKKLEEKELEEEANLEEQYTEQESMEYKAIEPGIRLNEEKRCYDTQEDQDRHNQRQEEAEPEGHGDVATFQSKADMTCKGKADSVTSRAYKGRR